MIDAFPGTEIMDPDHYNGALAAALTQHPREIAIACADIAKGVVTECMFRQALTSARVHDWCKRHSAEMSDWLARHNERVDTANKCGTAEVDRSNHDTIDELRARLGPTFGLKPVPRGGLVGRIDEEEGEEAQRQRRREQAALAFEASSKAIYADYAANGLEPIVSGGMPVSRELAALLGRPAKPLPDAKAGKRQGRRNAEKTA